VNRREASSTVQADGRFARGLDAVLELEVFLDAGLDDEVPLDAADGNDGHWFFVEYDSRADKTIFFVDYESRADLKVFFVDYESRAGWRNKSKQHLLY
jgi:hypothetical protein